MGTLLLDALTNGDTADHPPVDARDRRARHLLQPGRGRAVRRPRSAGAGLVSPDDGGRTPDRRTRRATSGCASRASATSPSRAPARCSTSRSRPTPGWTSASTSSGAPPIRSQWHLIGRRFFRHKLAVISLLVIVLFGAARDLRRRRLAVRLQPAADARDARRGARSSPSLGAPRSAPTSSAATSSPGCCTRCRSRCSSASARRGAVGAVRRHRRRARRLLRRLDRPAADALHRPRARAARRSRCC